MDHPERNRRWLAWAASATLLVYTQYMGVLLLGAEALVALLCLRLAAVRPLAMLVVAVLAVAPWVWAAMGSHVTSGGNPLDLIAWMNLPSGQDLAFQLVAAFGDGPVRVRWLLVIVLATLAWGGTLLFRQHRVDAARLLILLGAVGTPFALFAIARVASQPIFAPRQLIAASFCLLLLLVLCASALPRVVGAAVMSALLVCGVLAVPTILPATRNPPWPDIVKYLDEERGGAAVHSPESWITDPLLFYRGRGVYGPTSMTAGEDGDSSLLLCRPGRCRPEKYGDGFAQVRNWRWGKDSVNELILLERQ